MRQLSPRPEPSSPAVQWVALAACLFFFFAGRAFIPHLGLQNDEALFGHALYEPKAGLPTAEVFGRQVPLMLMSYLGVTKSWLYGLIFRAVRPGLNSIRTPMLLAGLLTLWLFYRLLRRITGEGAAMLGICLLAADAIFLLTTCFDWGPVALQHLCLVAGTLLVLRFHQEGSARALGGGFFLLGLGLWDKALMVWMLSGMAVAAVLVFPRQVFAALRPRTVVIATLAFCLGALPLIVYNVENGWETFRGNTAFDFSDIPNKARLLEKTASGDALFGWLVAENHETPHPHEPSTWLQRGTAALSGSTGGVRHSLIPLAFVLALLLTPLARPGERRAIVFVLLALAIAWTQMAITRNAGGSVHHTVLLWPFPYLVIAVSWAAAARRCGRFARPALAVVLVVLLIPSLLVMNQYYAQEQRNGGDLNWSDAIVPLAVYLRGVEAHNVFCVDWGILDSVRLLNRGRTPVRVGSDPISKPSLSADDLDVVRRWLTDPANVFVAHTAGNEFFQDTNAKLVKAAAAMGYAREMMQVVPDRFGRNIFEVYRFRPTVTEPRP